MELSFKPAWLPILYLLIHSSLILVSRKPVREKSRILAVNLAIGLIFTSLLFWMDEVLPVSLFAFLVKWSPVIFFWWAYLWAKHTLEAVHPRGFTLDLPILRFEERRFGQPSLWWSRNRRRWLTELFHVGYCSYFLYTPVLGIWLDAMGRPVEFQSMTFAVLTGYLISYPLFSLAPLYGPRWSLVSAGLLDPSEQLQRGYLVTRMTNWIFFRGPAHRGGAMPSSHSSTALIFLVWSWRVWPLEVAVISTLLAVGMWLGSIYGRYHFVLDVLLGAIIGLVALLLGDLLIGP